MTKRLFTMGLSLAALLAGCQSQAMPGAVEAPLPTSFSIRDSEPMATPKLLDEPQMRRLLQVAGTASLWGISYAQSYVAGRESILVNRRHAGYREYRSYTGNAAFSGKNDLLRTAYNRYVYRVPADQVLVLNTVEGSGTVYVNGYGLGTSQPRTIHYLFGPGETVVLNFDPSILSTRYIDGRQTYRRLANYHRLSISGFTISPSLLGGTGALGGSK